MNEMVEEVLKHYPKLKFSSKSGKIYGDLNVDKKDEDIYEVEIDFSDFPNSFPKVWEIGERIPPKIDRHINRDLSCCFTTQVKEKIYLKTKIFTLKNFVDYILIPFLQNNSFFELNGKYKNGEHSHSKTESTIESYIDILGIKDLSQILSLIHI